MDLHELRMDLDRIDTDIVSLYEKRLKICEQIAEYKISVGKPILDLAREQEKTREVRALCNNSRYAEKVESLYVKIMEDSRELQSQYMKAKSERDR